MPRPNKRQDEREFIRGNQDGPGGTSETYTVCRLRVPRRRLLKETGLGLHPHFLTLPKCWECPAHIFLKAQQKYQKHHETADDQQRFSPPKTADLERWRKSSLCCRPGEAMEIIHKDPDRKGSRSTYTICRIAVPRERMVSEVREGLHPGYHVRRSSTADASRELHVKGNPTEPFDNVDHPKSQKARPGFGPRELCPYRLLRPGAQVHAG